MRYDGCFDGDERTRIIREVKSIGFSYGLDIEVKRGRSQGGTIKQVTLPGLAVCGKDPSG